MSLIQATDRDFNNTIEYSMVTDVDGIFVNRTTGELLVTGLDAEKVLQMQFNLTVRASDQGGLNSTTTVIVNLQVLTCYFLYDECCI